MFVGENTSSSGPDPDDFPPAPLPPHERAWRHPSEIGAAAGSGIESSTALRSVGRGVTAFSIASGVLVVIGLALLSRPVSGRSDTADAIRLSGANIELVSLDDSRSDAPIAVMVEQGPLLVTTRAAVGDRSQLRVRLTDGSTHDVEVIHIDDATSIAILALPLDEPAPTVSLPNVPITRDQDVVVFSERAHRMSVMSLADDRRAVIGTRSTTFDPFSVAEGAPVIDRAGRLIGLCTHEGNDVVLIDTNSIQSVLSSLLEGLGSSD